MIRTIPLNKLIQSSRNVRRSKDPQADLELKADIEARGLLQNLVVTSVRKPRGRFAVEAGERRRQALQSLADEGKLPADHDVCCLVLQGAAKAREASLAENFQRLSMNPADECLAFQQLIEQGSDPDGIARRFGLTVRFVEGRLRLAGLAPVVFEALGSGEISLDVAKAYAATPDGERQTFVFEQMGCGYAASHPDSIRRLMTQATASANDRRARFVGEEAYVTAGGRIERDLFSDEAGARWLDPPLLERLATEKLEALAADKVNELGLAWVRPTLDSWVGYEATEGLRRVVPEREPLTDEETARIEAAHAEIEAFVELLEDEDASDAARAEAEEKVEALEREITDLGDKPPIIDEVMKPKLGTFLLLDETGVPRLDAIFYAEAPLEAEETDSGGKAVETSATRSDPISGNGKECLPKPLPRALVDELAIQRRDLLAVHVAADPKLAHDLAIFLMVDRDAAYSSERSGSSLLALPPSDPVFGFKTPEARAPIARAHAAEALERNWADGATAAERFEAFRGLSEEARMAWLGHAVARTLEASANAPGERRCHFHDHLGSLLGIDVAEWWRPTGSNYFDRVPKAVTLAALEEVDGVAFASRYSGLKKAELSEAAERIFAGEFIADAEAKARALAWVPEPMRFVPVPEAVAAEETPPWEEASSSDDPGAGEPETDSAAQGDEAKAEAKAEAESGGSDVKAGSNAPSESAQAA